MSNTSQLSVMRNPYFSDPCHTVLDISGPCVTYGDSTTNCESCWVSTCGAMLFCGSRTSSRCTLLPLVLSEMNSFSKKMPFLGTNTFVLRGIIEVVSFSFFWMPHKKAFIQLRSQFVRSLMSYISLTSPNLEERQSRQFFQSISHMVCFQLP